MSSLTLAIAPLVAGVALFSSPAVTLGLTLRMEDDPFDFSVDPFDFVNGLSLGPTPRRVPRA